MAKANNGAGADKSQPQNNIKKKYNVNKKAPKNVLAQDGDSTSKLKKRKRDIQRLLQKQDLPSNIRLEKEKALQAVNLQLQSSVHQLKARTYSKKYHMVKFFERKKALRKYKQAKKELDELAKQFEAAKQKANLEDEDMEDAKDSKSVSMNLKKEIKKARKKLFHCEIDVLYVVNYPKDSKYIALYPKDEAVKPSELPDEIKKGKLKTDQKRQQLKKNIQEMVENKTIPFTIEDILKGEVDHHKLIQHQQQNFRLEEPDKIAQKSKKTKGDEKAKAKEEDDFFE